MIDTPTTYNTIDKPVYKVAKGDRFMLADSFVVVVTDVQISDNVMAGRKLSCGMATFNFDNPDACMSGLIVLELSENHMLGIITD